MRIICDTSVWYRISETPSCLKKWSSCTLIATWESFFEITTAVNLIKEDIRVKKSLMALEAMVKTAKEFIHINPYEFIVGDGLRSNWVKDVYNSFQYYKVRGNIDVKAMATNTSLFVEERKYARMVAAQMMNTSIESMRQNPISNPGKKEIDKLFNVYRSSVIKYYTDQILGFYDGILPRQINWADHEFFLTMFSNYLILLVKDTQRKFKPNDFGDLDNMVYVKESESYLTCDKKTWLTVAKLNSDTGKRFLYFDNEI